MTDPAAKQDPLAALEDVLKNAQQQPAANTPPAALPADPAAPPVDPAAEEAKKRQELSTLETQHKQQDEADLKTQMDDLHQMTLTSAQTAESKAAETPAPPPPADTAGFEIRQLDHTKIKKDS